METHPASQIILYAKGRFNEEGGLMEDLRVLVGNYTATLPEHVSTGDILRVLSDIAIPFLLAGSNPEWRLSDLLLSLAEYPPARHSTPAEFVARELLRILLGVKVRDGERVLINLDDPNPDLLPVRAICSA
ncbi:MAG TPA: hypothetical protein VI794_02190 [Patescibacteria group bacterium]|nr:hypothetical protein [Patescibacteria group bacterium]